MKIDKSFWNNFLGVKIQNFWNTKNYIDFSAKIQSMLKSEKKKLKKEFVNEIGVQFFTRSSKKSEPFVSCARVRQ